MNEKKVFVGAVTVKTRKSKIGYYAYYRDENGQQHLRSLKTTNQKKAVERAKEINDALEGGTIEKVEEVKKK
jgi:predicted RNase H-related nuclease YkuK (DUF458 family)